LKTFESRKPIYEDLLNKAVIPVEWHMRLAAFYGRYLDSKKRYDFVSIKTGVPSLLIAAIHLKEASGSFTCNLHNGQSLAIVTTIVPKGRGPFDTWEDSALDVFAMKKALIERVASYGEPWSIAQCLYLAESYNGFGYIARGINSPYLWCGTNHYTKGGYKRDGVYDPDHVITNLGVATILTAMESELQSTGARSAC